MEALSANGMTTPGRGYEDAPLPKRSPSRTLLPSTWVGRTVRLGYVGVDGQGVETSGQLLDWCGAGVVVALAGDRTIVAWDRLATLALVAE